MTAQQARKISDEASSIKGSGKVADQMARVKLKIQQAAKRGDVNINPEEDILVAVKAELEKEGFLVTTTQDYPFGTWTIISW